MLVTRQNALITKVGVAWHIANHFAQGYILITRVRAHTHTHICTHTYAHMHTYICTHAHTEHTKLFWLKTAF